MAETEDNAWMARARCPGLTLVLFTRQLATMLRSGVPLMVALDTLSYQPDYPNFGEVVSHTAKKIAEGHSFSKTLERFPRVFPRVYLAMVSIGESTGQLDDSLEKLANWQEEDLGMYQRVKGALSYPAFVLCLTFTLTLLLFYTVLPGFIDIFLEMKIELPLMTRILIAITNAVSNPGAWFLLGAWIFGSVAWLRAVWQTEVGSVKLFRIALSVPIVGTILRYATLSRYSGAAGALIESGLELTRTLKMSAEASGSPILRQDSKHLVVAIQEGSLVSTHMGMRPDIYPPSLCQMLLAGEESSQLSEMFYRVSAYYDSEVSYKTDTLGAVLEPLLLGVLALIVGSIVIAVLVPLYSYLGTLA